MKILSVNRALPQLLEINGKMIPTGIYKEPVDTPVQVHELGLEGDGQADLTVHGGPYQALYAYPHEHYAYWERELGSPGYPAGTFGENLTVTGLLETEVCIGDVHRMGEVMLQVTGERLPCFKLGHKLNRPQIMKPFLQSGRSGFYYRVVKMGSVRSGETIEIAERDPRGVTVRELLGMHRMGEGSRESIIRALEVEALAPPVREDLEARLGKM